MARGKFNKRGGGKRVDAQSADEIEQRNQRLAEFEENRAKRRAEEEEAEDGGGDDENEESDEKGGEKSGGDAGKGKGPSPPVVVTSEEDHKKNLAKLEIVRKRREQAEARRKAEQEAELAAEMERKAQLKKHEEDDSDDDGKKKKKKSKAKDIPKLSKIEIKKMKPSQMKDGKYKYGVGTDWTKDESGIHATLTYVSFPFFASNIMATIIVPQHWKKEGWISKVTKMHLPHVFSSTKETAKTAKRSIVNDIVSVL